MARYSPIKNSFVAGELTPRLEGRDDLDQYHQGMRQALNGIVLPHGGFMRRSGSHFVAETKTSSKLAVLLPFIFSTTQAYALEFGDLYVRFFTNEGVLGAPLEVVTPYTEAQLRDVFFVQEGDVLYLVHPDHANRKLTRTSATTFSIAKVVYREGRAPMRLPNLGATPTITVTGSLPTLTLTASAPLFVVADDVGRAVRIKDGLNEGWFLITAVSSTTVATATLEGSESTDKKAITAMTQANPVVVTVVNTFSNGQKVRIETVRGQVEVNDRVFEVTAASGTAITLLAEDGTAHTAYDSGGEVSLAFPDTPAANHSLGLYSDNEGARAVLLHEGRLGYGGSKKEPDRWVLSDSDDFDRFGLAATLDDNSISRRTVGGQVNDIQWMAAGDEVMSIGTAGQEFKALGANDDTITPSGAVVKPTTSRGSAHVTPVLIDNQIIFLQRNSRKLRELKFDINVDALISRDISILAEHIMNQGGLQMTYQQDPDSVIWVPRADGTLVGFTFEAEQKVIGAHRHEMGGKFDGDIPAVDSAVVIPHPQQIEDQLWLIVKRTIDGVTKRYVEFIEEQFRPNVTVRSTVRELIDALEDGWFVDSGLELNTPLTITGITLANPGVVTVVNTLANGDQVKIVKVKGTTEINQGVFLVANVTGTTVELQDLSGVNFDTSSFTAYSSGGELRKMVDVLSNLGHLEGESIQIMLDGNTHPNKTVVSASVTLDRKGAKARVGLQFDTVGETQRFVGGGTLGTDQGQKAKIQRVVMRLHNTAGILVGVGSNPADEDLEDILFREGDHPMDESPPLYTGDKQVPVPGGWTEEPTIFFKQNLPFPMTVLSIMPRVESGER